ncbi:MAG: hypothetical protein WC654_00810 [Patescibacteria group bacterium]
MEQNIGGVSVEWDETLVSAFVQLFQMHKSVRPAKIIETGTYHGTGSTAHVVEAIRRCHKRPHLVAEMYSIEADEKNYEIAKKNLAGFPWVRVIHGSSVALDDAEDFITHDAMLLNHEEYPGISIDSKDPVPFYLAEIRGKLPNFGGKEQGADDVFESLKPEIITRVCLFMLDSAGGIGYLEFQKMQKMMGNRLYYVWMHDTNHVKHFRSVRDIRKSPETWGIVAERQGEWILAEHRKTR